MSFLADHLSSVQALELTVRDKTEKARYEGRVLGLFLAPQLLTLQLSPLRIVLKKTLGKYHLIHQLSYPKWKSVNDAVPGDFCLCLCHPLG